MVRTPPSWPTAMRAVETSCGFESSETSSDTCSPEVSRQSVSTSFQASTRARSLIAISNLLFRQGVLDEGRRREQPRIVVQSGDELHPDGQAGGAPPCRHA